MLTGDLSQLGLKRGALLPEQSIPAVDAASITLTTTEALSHPFITKLFPVPDLGANVTPKSLQMVISTAGLLKVKLPDAQKKKLQDAIRPTASDIMTPLLNDVKLRDFNSKIDNGKDVDCAIIASFITSQFGENKPLFDFAIGQDIAQGEEATMTTQATADPKKIATASYATLLTLKSKSGELPGNVKRSWDRIEYLSLLKAYGLTDALMTHPVVEPLFKELYAEHSVAHYEAPDFLAALIKPKVLYPNIVLKVGYTKSTDGSWVDCVVKPANDGIAKEFAMFALMHKQSAHPLAEHNFEVAFTRVLVIRHALITGSKECAAMTVDEPIPVDVAAIDFFVASLRKPELFYAGIFMSAISFLKSGHHATTFNIEYAYQKVLSSMSIQVDVSKAARMVNSIVYWGTHPANMLLLVNYMYHRAKHEKMSGALTYRMHPVPPMFAGYCNLELFIDAIHVTGFFELMNSEAEYDDFKRNMSIIRSKMHLCAPYAYYLFGVIEDDPTDAKNEVAKFAAYATSIDAVLPGGTLNLSPSLRKLAQEQGKNSIAASLQIDAFVRAYRRFFGQIIEGKMRAALPKARQQALLE
jgi:hypothetical protein